MKTFHQDNIEALAHRMHDGVVKLLAARHPHLKFDWDWATCHPAHKEKWLILAEWHANELAEAETRWPEQSQIVNRQSSIVDKPAPAPEEQNAVR